MYTVGESALDGVVVSSMTSATSHSVPVISPKRVSKILINQVIIYTIKWLDLNEPRCEKTGLRGFRPGPTQTGLYSYRRWLEAGNFGFR